MKLQKKFVTFATLLSAWASAAPDDLLTGTYYEKEGCAVIDVVKGESSDLLTATIGQKNTSKCVVKAIPGRYTFEIKKTGPVSATGTFSQLEKGSNVLNLGKSGQVGFLIRKVETLCEITYPDSQFTFRTVRLTSNPSQADQE